MEPDDSEEFIRGVFQDTDIARKPIAGFVKGYHRIPYVLVGPDKELERGSVKLEGKITVGPKLVVPVGKHHELFKEIFPEDEPFMDKSLVSRTFSYKLLPRVQQGGVKIQGSQVTLERLAVPDNEVLQSVMEGLSQREVINTGVIWCPNPRFYPVSLERFILSIMDKEFE